MEFGRLSDIDFNTIDFSLPAEPPGNAALLQTNPQPTKFYVGCAKWGRKDWVGEIYPGGTKEADFLTHYAKHFNAIELNASFYKMPSAKQTAAWSSKVPDDFRFCPKVTGQISHVKRLNNVAEGTQRFLEGIAGFGTKLGPVFLMTHPAMTAKSFENLEKFFQLLPTDIQLFAELRHESWLEPTNVSKLFSLLSKYNVGWVITDVAGRRDCAHMQLTVPKTFIRFNGNGMHPTDFTRIDEWVQRLKHWKQSGIHEVYFFMHQENEVHSPRLAKYLVDQMNSHCQSNLRSPQFLRS